MIIIIIIRIRIIINATESVASHPVLFYTSDYRINYLSPPPRSV